VALLWRFAAPHRAWLALGALGSVGVVAARLAIPWPLRWVIDLASGPAPHAAGAGSSDEALAMSALAYLGLAVVLGTSELVQRTQLGRFTAHLVDDLRSAALKGARRGGLVSEVGEVTARVVGDAARLRNDLTGILVHASTNGLLYLAASSVMLWVSWVFGLLFLASGALSLWVGAATSRSVAAAAARNREKEGQYAASIHAELEGSVGPFGDVEDLGARSRVREMRGVRRTGRASLLVHVIQGSAVSFGLWFGVEEVWVGQIAAGDLFVFAAYALTVHRRMVQVGRQFARTGKVVASANRLGELIGLEDRRTGDLERAEVGFRLEGAKVDRGRNPDRKVRVRRLDLELPPGSRTLVTGRVGSGKTTLLELLAGQQAQYRGTLHWDGSAMRASDAPPVGTVALLSRNPVFPSRELWQLMGLADASGPGPEEEQTLRRIGAFTPLRALGASWDVKLSSSEVSTEQARLIALSKLLLGGGFGAWILDGALELASSKKARARLGEILRRAGGRTVVVSCYRALEPERFDRIVALRRGRVAFDGTPEEWAKTHETTERG